MKVFIIILAVLSALIAAVCLVRVSLRIRYIDSLTVDIRIAGIPHSRLLKLFKKKKSSKKEQEGKSEDKNSQKKEKKPVIDSLADILNIVDAFSSKFFGHVKVRLAHIVIAVASGDPAKTAVSYGAVIQSVAYITELLKRKTNFKAERDAVIDIRPDFTAEKTVAQIDIRLSVGVGGVLHSLLCAAWAHLTK